jgi:hypothetical protein
MTITIWFNEEESENWEDGPVPRKGEHITRQTEAGEFQHFEVEDVHWDFRSIPTATGRGPMKTVSVDIYLKTTGSYLDSQLTTSLPTPPQ